MDTPMTKPASFKPRVVKGKGYVSHMWLVYMPCARDDHHYDSGHYSWRAAIDRALYLMAQTRR
jgi:hypothetical protein